MEMEGTAVASAAAEAVLGEPESEFEFITSLATPLTPISAARLPKECLNFISFPTKSLKKMWEEASELSKNAEYGYVCDQSDYETVRDEELAKLRAEIKLQPLEEGMIEKEKNIKDDEVIEAAKENGEDHPIAGTSLENKREGEDLADSSSGSSAEAKDKEAVTETEVPVAAAIPAKSSYSNSCEPPKYSIDRPCLEEGKRNMKARPLITTETMESSNGGKIRVVKVHKKKQEGYEYDCEEIRKQLMDHLRKEVKECLEEEIDWTYMKIAFTKDKHAQTDEAPGIESPHELKILEEGIHKNTIDETGMLLPRESSETSIPETVETLKVLNASFAAAVKTLNDLNRVVPQTLEALKGVEAFLPEALTILNAFNSLIPEVEALKALNPFEALQILISAKALTPGALKILKALEALIRKIPERFILASEISEPEAQAPRIPEPETKAPEVSELEAHVSKVPEPATQPIETSSAEPKTQDCKLLSPETTALGIPQPQNQSPEITEPKAEAPKMPEPEREFLEIQSHLIQVDQAPATPALAAGALQTQAHEESAPETTEPITNMELESKKEELPDDSEFTVNYWNLNRPFDI